MPKRSRLEVKKTLVRVSNASENRAKKVSEKSPFEIWTVWFSDVDCKSPLTCLVKFVLNRNFLGHLPSSYFESETCMVYSATSYRVDLF